MAEVNTGAWGDVEDWIDGVTYDNDMPEDKRIKHSEIIHDLVNDNKLSVGIPFDRTISYCGLGVKSPLSHITHLRYHTVYWNGGWFEGQPFSEVLYDYTTTDNRTITNFPSPPIRLANWRNLLPITSNLKPKER